MTYEELCAGVNAGTITCPTAEMFLLLAKEVCGGEEPTGELATACNATAITQAQFDAATSVKILACLNGGTIGAITADMLGGSSAELASGSGASCYAPLSLPAGVYFLEHWIVTTSSPCVEELTSYIVSHSGGDINANLVSNCTRCTANGDGLTYAQLSAA